MHQFGTVQTVILTLSPEVAYVCLGEPFAFTCTTNATALQWNVTTSRNFSRTRLTYPNIQIAPLVLQELMLSFNIAATNQYDSRSDSMVLVSVISPNRSATVNMNGTVVRCELVDVRIERSAVIHVIGTDHNDGRFIEFIGHTHYFPNFISIIVHSPP